MSEPWNSPQNMIRRAQDELDRLQQAPSQGQSGADQPPVPEGTGEAEEGKIRVRVSAGRISEVIIDPRAMRLPSQDLATAFRDAANAAIDDQNTRVTEGLPGMPSLGELSRTLNEISADSARALEQSSQGISDAISAVQRISELHRRRD